MTMKVTAASFVACLTSKEGMPTDNLPVIALVGRSNVGKSSLINTLSARRELAKTSSMPGKTLTINFYLFNDAFYLVDLPGYGYSKASKITKARIQKMMDDFFEVCSNLKGVIQILDIRHPPSTLDKQMLTWIRDQKTNYLAILTKSDKVGPQNIVRMQRQIMKDLKLGFSMNFSAKSKQGREELLGLIENILGNKTYDNTTKKEFSERPSDGPRRRRPDHRPKRPGSPQSSQAAKEPSGNPKTNNATSPSSQPPKPSNQPSTSPGQPAKPAFKGGNRRGFNRKKRPNNNNAHPKDKVDQPKTIHGRES